MPHPARRQLKKGQTPPAIGLKADCGCQGSLIVVIPTVVADFGYFPFCPCHNRTGLPDMVSFPSL